MSSENNKIMSVVFISSCAIFLLFLFLSQWDFLTNLNYRLHEICYLPVISFLFLIPLEALVGFVLWIRYRRDKSGASIMNPILNVISVVSLIVCISLYVYILNGVTVEGQVNNIEIHGVNQGYYITINNKMVKLSDEQVEAVKDNNKWYHFQYKYNKLTPAKCTMTIFELDPVQ